MSDLERIKAAANASWMMFKKHTGTDCTDAKWNAIVSESGAIWEECGRDKVAQQIIFGFVEALEAEDKIKRGN